MLAEHTSRYAFCRKYVKGKRVLDVACGSGYGSLALVENGAKCVVGLDKSPKAISYARKHYPHTAIKYLICDATNLPQTYGKFDLVVSFETLEHLANPEGFIKSLKEVLTQKGILIISTPNKKFSLGNNPFHTKEFDFGEFRSMLDTNFKQVRLYGQRSVFVPIYKVLLKISKIHPMLKGFLAFRPWEPNNIKRIISGIDTNYVYFIAVARLKK
jgi:ubiquinone/menaquinone biosynthesis C-methylase UbiE